MNKKILSHNTKESSNHKNVDPKLWDRLIWQEAIDKAIKKNRDKHVQKNMTN